MASRPASSSIQLPSFAQAFRSPSPQPYHPNNNNNGSNNGQMNHNNNNPPPRLAPLRYASEGRSGSRGGPEGEVGRKRGYEEVDHDAAERMEEDLPVKPEPSPSPTASPQPKRQRTHPHPAAPPPNPNPNPLPNPISPVVMGFSIDTPTQLSTVRKSLGLKQQQQAIIQSRNSASASASNPGTSERQTLAARRGPLTASKAANLTILTSNSTPPQTTATGSYPATNTYVPAPGRPALHHPTSALRAALPTVHSAPPQRTRFDVPSHPPPNPHQQPHPQHAHAQHQNPSPPPITTLESDPTLNSNARGYSSIRQEVEPVRRPGHQHSHSSYAGAPPQRSGTGSGVVVPGVPVRSYARATPSVLRPMADSLPTPARPLFQQGQAQGQQAHTHFYPFGQGGGQQPHAHAYPLPSAPLPAPHQPGLRHQQQQPPSQSQPQPQPTPGSASSPDDKSTFLAPFSTFYDSLADARRLKDWLNDQLHKSAQVLQTLQASSGAIEELFERKVRAVREEGRREREELRERVRVLEERVGRVGMGEGAGGAGGADVEMEEGGGGGERAREGERHAGGGSEHHADAQATHSAEQ